MPNLSNFNNLINELKHYKKIHGLEQTISTTELKLLKAQVPIQKIVGFINFDNLKIEVKQRVLIPRYETQEVVLKALELIHSNAKVLDLGCGSGYIGLTIKQALNCDVTLSDIDLEAIKQTKHNAQLNSLNVRFIQSNLFANIYGRFDLIISNPPYIPNTTILAKTVLNYEPHHALFGGLDGNDFYRSIIELAPNFLAPNGYLVFELGLDNVDFLTAEGFTIYQDINNKPRIAVKQFNFDKLGNSMSHVD